LGKKGGTQATVHHPAYPHGRGTVCQAFLTVTAPAALWWDSSPNPHIADIVRQIYLV
jgi:hypothetical protein